MPGNRGAIFDNGFLQRVFNEPVKAETLELPGKHAVQGIRKLRKVQEGKPDLLEVVAALHPRGGLADLLHGGQEQADQDGDDRDDNQ